MANAQSDPADTTMMRIVHDALRRDLARAQSTLGADPPPGPARRRAIAAHLAWMMQFLRAHHRSEDEGMYPLVRQRAEQRGPEVLELLETMDRQHHAIAQSISAVEAAAAALQADATDVAMRPMLTALDDLAVSLLPHLRQEEDDAMPVVSALVTNAEWQANEQRNNIKGKSLAQLGFEGHWLVDDVSDEDRARVTHLVPAIPRFILLHGFARSYRRRREALWEMASRPRRRVQKRGHVAVSVNADIDAIWDIVCDVTRVGEWSHECVGASWIGDAKASTPGARFRGRNRAGIVRWPRVCEIVAAHPYQLVWRTVPSLLYPDSTEWTITLHKTEGGTRIEQRFRVIRAPKLLLDTVYATFIPPHRDRSEALTDDLRRLGELAKRPAEQPLPALIYPARPRSSRRGSPRPRAGV